MGLSKIISGPRLPLVAAAAIAVVLAGILVIFGIREESLRLVIRTTARSSFILFLSAFIAQPFRTLSNHSSAHWLYVNRRWLIVSFAVSHLGHAAALLSLGIFTGGAFFKTIDALTLIGGGAAYLLIITMAILSFDTCTGWINRRSRRAIFAVGTYFVWGIFLFDYTVNVPRSLFYAPFVVLLVLANFFATVCVIF